MPIRGRLRTVHTVSGTPANAPDSGNGLSHFSMDTLDQFWVELNKHTRIPIQGSWVPLPNLYTATLYSCEFPSSLSDYLRLE